MDKEELTVKNWREFLEGEVYAIDAQCVRSVSQWSAGVKTKEASIHNAYMEMISDAKHFIFIQVSSLKYEKKTSHGRVH